MHSTASLCRVRFRFRLIFFNIVMWKPGFTFVCNHILSEVTVAHRCAYHFYIGYGPIPSRVALLLWSGVHVPRFVHLLDLGVFVSGCRALSFP